jgi:hypothetical protein
MKKPFPEWGKVLYRGIRAGVSAGIVAVMTLKIDLADPEEALQVIAITFGTAFLVAFGKHLRNKFISWFGWDEKSLVARMMPI